jgi:membrane protease YdiL (CAAX protease family)
MLSVKPWRGLEILQFFGALLFCVCLGGIVSASLGHLGVSGFVELDGFGNIALGTFCFQGMSCVLAVVFLKRHQVNWRDAFGLRDPQLKRAVRIALLFFVVVLPIVWLLQSLSVLTLTRLGYPPDEQEAVRLLENADSWWARAYLGLFAAALAPVSEEFIFRGLLYPFIKQLGWPRLAFVSVSLLFALIHLHAAIFFPLVVLAMALTWLYEKTDNLFAPILVHALFNTTNLLILALNHFGILEVT